MGRCRLEPPGHTRRHGNTLHLLLATGNITTTATRPVTVIPSFYKTGSHLGKYFRTISINKTETYGARVSWSQVAVRPD